MDLVIERAKKILIYNGPRINRSNVNLSTIHSKIPEGGSLWIVYITKEVISSTADYVEYRSAVKVPLDGAKNLGLYKTVDDLKQQLEIGIIRLGFSRELICYKIVLPKQPIGKRIQAFFAGYI